MFTMPATVAGILLLCGLLVACSNPYEARRRARYGGLSPQASARPYDSARDAPTGAFPTYAVPPPSASAGEPQPEESEITATTPPPTSSTAVTTNNYVWLPGHYRTVGTGSIWQAGAWVYAPLASSYYGYNPYYYGFGPYYGGYGYYGLGYSYGGRRWRSRPPTTHNRQRVQRSASYYPGVQRARTVTRSSTQPTADRSVRVWQRGSSARVTARPPATRSAGAVRRNQPSSFRRSRPSGAARMVHRSSGSRSGFRARGSSTTVRRSGRR